MGTLRRGEKKRARPRTQKNSKGEIKGKGGGGRAGMGGTTCGGQS